MELAAIIKAGEATPARILSLCNSLMFLILACFSRIGLPVCDTALPVHYRPLCAQDLLANARMRRREAQPEAYEFTHKKGVSRGVGGILFERDLILAAAAQRPDGPLAGFHAPKTQTIPLELLATTGLLYTLVAVFADRGVVFFIGQAVCAALCEGASRNLTSRRSLLPLHAAVITPNVRICIE